ncbi:uncharacterized protein LOC127812061 [Diospyros lotus]|uniref:uncharacterized protein LOC127812061 n=1 Tax=Diospyros lotus TaxID=55363 RepID=UPI00224DC678|nr:uncharacterized protein LOC127812061 [Diospyros lotus]
MGLVAAITCLVFIASPAAAYSAGGDEPTAYELLQEHNFPVGVLPKGVTGYDLDPSTGKFSAFLNGSCSFSLEGSYQLSYKSTISGYIFNGKLSRLTGVKVKLFLFWVDIVEVNRNGGDLEFSVGFASAGFPVENFEECPQCGCGLDCPEECRECGIASEASKLRSNPMAVSYSS